MAERLQKLIAAAGLMSRRSAENAIRAGRVTRNGVPASLGDCAEPGDTVCLDGVPVRPAQRRVVVMLNKPRGVVTTMNDEKGRRSVADLVQIPGLRVYPVGRLDLDSEGLLLMTNDGALTELLTHPSHEVVKTYQVTAEGEKLDAAVSALSQPMTIEGYALRPAQVRLLRREGEGTALLSVSIHEGRNRQVRRMCEAVGLRVRRLVRVSEGPLRLGALPPGKWRYLTEDEIESLMRTT